MRIDPKLLTAARKAAEKAAAEERSVARARLTKAGRDTFYLRTRSHGYDWDAADPDRILPTLDLK
jgi:hypothetical protein